MKEHPILFNDAMVRAVLDGRKTQTRRGIKIPTRSMLGCKGLDYMLVDDHSPMTGEPGWFGWVKGESIEPYQLKCPFGAPGDRLWVREVFLLESNRQVTEITDYKPPFNDGRPIDWRNNPEIMENFWTQPHYRATDPKPDLICEGREEGDCAWRPQLHMERWASRILLEVQEVRVERVQDITEEDAKAEGLKCLTKDGGITYKYGVAERDGWPGPKGWEWDKWEVSPIAAFAKLWDSINKKKPGRTWANNPWVWVITFRRM